jgi:hypothetical protein
MVILLLVCVAVVLSAMSSLVWNLRSIAQLDLYQLTFSRNSIVYPATTEDGVSTTTEKKKKKKAVFAPRTRSTNRTRFQRQTTTTSSIPPFVGQSFYSSQQKQQREQPTSTSTTNSSLGVIVLLAPPRNMGSLWNIDRFCLLLRAVRSLDQHLNTKFGPYPIVILVARDYSFHPNPTNDGPYTTQDRALLQQWAPHSTILFQEIDMYSGPEALGTMVLPVKDDTIPPVNAATTTTTTTKTTVTTPRELIFQWRQGRGHHNDDGSIPGRDIGYTSMCRLWSGRLQQMEFLQQYDYYMRMDDDSLLIHDLKMDPFLQMHYHHHHHHHHQEERQPPLNYVYRRDAHDHWGIDELWRIAKPHVQKAAAAETATSSSVNVLQDEYKNKNDASTTITKESTTHRDHQFSWAEANLPFLSVVAHPSSHFEGDDEVFIMDKNPTDNDQIGPLASVVSSSSEQNVQYLGHQPYNNFHISKVSFWKSPSWLALWDDLNDQQAFFKYRVGDANVHAMALMMMPRGTYQKWPDFPYVHNSNDMPHGWGKKAWNDECQAAYRNKQ